MASGSTTDIYTGRADRPADRQDVLPVVLGVLYCVADESFEAQVNARLPEDGAINRDLNGLLRRGHTWDVDA